MGGWDGKYEGSRRGRGWRQPTCTAQLPPTHLILAQRLGTRALNSASSASASSSLRAMVPAMARRRSRRVPPTSAITLLRLLGVGSGVGGWVGGCVCVGGGGRGGNG